MYTWAYSALRNECNGEEEVGHVSGFDIVRRAIDGMCRGECYISREMTTRRLFLRDPIEPIEARAEESLDSERSSVVRVRVRRDQTRACLRIMRVNYGTQYMRTKNATRFVLPRQMNAKARTNVYVRHLVLSTLRWKFPRSEKTSDAPRTAHVQGGIRANLSRSNRPPNSDLVSLDRTVERGRHAAKGRPGWALLKFTVALGRPFSSPKCNYLVMI